MDQLKPFWVPGRIGKPLIILVWLVIVWVLFLVFERKKSVQELSKKILHIDYIIVFVLLVLLFNFISNLIQTNFNQNVIREGLNVFTMFLGYYIIRDIFSRTTKKNIDSFINFVVLINILGLIIFVVDRIFKLNLIPQGYSVLLYQGEAIQRSFLPTPFFWLGLCFVLARTKWRIIEFIELVIYFLAIILTGTRSILIICFILLLLAIVLQLSQKKQTIIIFQKLLWVFLFIVLTITVITPQLKSNFAYLSDRLFNVINNTNSEENTLNTRISDLSRTINLVNRYNPSTGFGFVGKFWGYMGAGRDVIAFSDCDFVAIIWRSGFIGAFLIMLLYIFSLFQSFKSYRSKTFQTNNNSMMPFILIISLLTISSVYWIIFNSDQFFVLNLFPFVLVDYQNRFHKSTEEVPAQNNSVNRNLINITKPITFSSSLPQRKDLST